MPWFAYAVAAVALALLLLDRLRSRRRDEQFRNLVDHSPAAVVVFDESTVLYANHRVIDIVGDGDAEAVIGRRIDEVLAPETAELASASFRTIQESAEPLSVKDFAVAGRTGRVIRCDLVMVPTEYMGASAVQCAFTPVDEKHAALLALRETEERFRRFFDELPLPMYRTRLDGTIVHANQALATMLGVADRNELVGVNASSFYADPKERARLAAIQVDEGLLENQISALETADGRAIWVRDSSHTIVDGGVEIFEGALADVTREQEFNDELRRRAVRQQTLAEIAQLALREIDAFSVLSDAPARVCDVLDAECVLIAQQQPGRGLITTAVAYRVDSVRERERLLRYVQSHVNEIPDDDQPQRLPGESYPGGEDLQGVAIALTGPQEAYGVIAAAGRGFAPSDGDQDSLAATAAILGSAVSRSRARAKLDQLMRSKDEFVASVSHELRTPLTVVAGLALELEQGWRTFSPEEMAEFITLIADQSREMGDLIEDLLVAARADIGKVPLFNETVDLRSCVDQVVASCSLGDRARITVTGGGIAGHADPIRCRQIIRNLITNAIRYGGPHIRVSVVENGGEALLTVFDDGVGVSDANRERIFTAYERGHEAGAGVPGSVGLGLSVSRQLTELMGGSISYRYDGGSLFEVRLPLQTVTAG
ncbi:MAG: PAS domain-containing sensor histidine kinase [Acidimicrobiia bacterium]|nr:PAS domain-containing sensor histidine kinase [Acidimicrobiia bacterium]